LSVDGQQVTVWDHDDWRVVAWQGRGYRLQRTPAPTIEETARDRGSGGAVGHLTAPMPGRVVKVSVEQGEQVTQNQPLIVLEAMKMEHIIEAPHAGLVTELSVRPGQQVSGGALLLTIGPSEDSRAVE
jgi:biotin carboxyl carrier protein